MVTVNSLVFFILHTPVIEGICSINSLCLVALKSNEFIQCKNINLRESHQICLVKDKDDMEHLRAMGRTATDQMISVEGKVKLYISYLNENINDAVQTA